MRWRTSRPGAFDTQAALEWRWVALWCGVGLVVVPAVASAITTLSFLSSLDMLAFDVGGRTGHQLRPLGTLVWLLGCGVIAWSLRGAREVSPSASPQRWGRASLLLLVITLVGGGLRMWDLDGLPYEMTSDHVEKLLDVDAVRGGARPVFLPENGGREPLQFYWTALLCALGLPLSFLTLKLGMAIVGMATIPLVFLAGRACAGEVTGLWGAGILALAPWHLQILRTATRTGFSTFFSALGLWLLVRALTSGRRSDWLALGVATGCGLYGYTGFRPFLLLIGVGVLVRLGYARGARGRQRVSSRAMVRHIAAASLVALSLAAPLARYAVERPGEFWARSATRLGVTDDVDVGSVGRRLAVNASRALGMVNVTTDRTWFQSPPERTALEPVGAALFVLGLAMAGWRASRGDWRAAIVILAYPVMVSASAFALAFPIEVPHLSRASGALPVVAILAALPLAAAHRQWVTGERAGRATRVAATALLVGVVALMARGSTRRVFVEYRVAYDLHTHPTREAASVARDFLAKGGRVQDVYLVSWPHGWDHRALARELDVPTWTNVMAGHRPDMADAAEAASLHDDGPEGRLYFVGGLHAQAHLAVLEALRPGVVVTGHRAEHSPRTFTSVWVPPPASACANGGVEPCRHPAGRR